MAWHVDRVCCARGEGMSGMSTPPDRILTMKEAAERLACPAEVVAQLVRETTLWGTKMDDGGWGIKESELQRFIEAMQRAKEK
jgi:excisionase family DNA binding protein